MLETHRSEPVAEAPPRPNLELVVDDAEASAASDEVPFETGLMRSLVVGGAIGFVLMFVLVGGGFLLVGMDAVTAAVAATFVAAFGGIGFGAMTSASIHQPPGAARH